MKLHSWRKLRRLSTDSLSFPTETFQLPNEDGPWRINSCIVPCGIHSIARQVPPVPEKTLRLKGAGI